MMATLGTPVGFEYFWQKEAEAFDPAKARVQAAEPNSFSLHGHRLSSLYRTFQTQQARLILYYLSVSFCQKYSNPTISS
jgi:hypothetical protein